MRAKFIYESLEDVLSPKTQEQITNDISKLSQQELDDKLVTASWNDHVDVVKLLLKAGANIDVKSKYGWTALMHASYNGHVDVIRLLLEAGADVEAKSNAGMTALMHASFNGHVSVVKLLKKYGAKE